MLAAVAPVVKFPALRSPEQAAVDQSLSVFWTLVERLHAAADQHQPIHHVEEAIAEMGEDYWPYGFERNRATLDTFLRYHHEQGFSQRRFAPEELFAPETLESAIV